MFPLATTLAVTVLIATPPAIRPDRPVDTAEALAALRAARAGVAAEGDALVGRPFRVAAPISPADWSYEPTFGALTYRPHPAFWSGSRDGRLASAVGLRLDDGRGEPMDLVLGRPPSTG